MVALGVRQKEDQTQIKREGEKRELSFTLLQFSLGVILGRGGVGGGRGAG